MFLDEVIGAQQRGEAKGIASVCSAHPIVIRQALKVSSNPLVEATCNQVNQLGGYTGMRPGDFVAFVRGIAKECGHSFEDVILGGDHLGPSVWQGETVESAMQKSEELIRAYVQAGFTKVHLDCSMRLADDPEGILDVELMAQRTARLAKVAESVAGVLEIPRRLRYIIGSEVPVPGGATSHAEGVSVTKVEDARQTIEATRQAFWRQGLDAAWDRVMGVVVQPGVEFGDDFVLPYRSAKAKELSKFIEGQAMVFEAHSTDYQTRDALSDLVRDHFAILKVGPALTFAYREAIFALAMIEAELIAKEKRSNIVQVLDDAMVRHPVHWKKYYRGSEHEQAHKRKYSLSDRARYYWVQPEVQRALEQLWQNLGHEVLPHSLLDHFLGVTNLTAQQVVAWRIDRVLNDYMAACEGEK